MEHVTAHTACQGPGHSLMLAAGSNPPQCSFCLIQGTGVSAPTRKAASLLMNHPPPNNGRESTVKPERIPELQDWYVLRLSELPA